MSTHRKRSGYRSINRRKRQTFYRLNPKIKKMSPEQEQQLKDAIAFSNSIAQQFFDFQKQTKNDIDFLKNEMIEMMGKFNELNKLIDANRSWIQICDKSIKEFRTQLNIITNAKLSVFKPLEVKTPKKWWKF